MTINSEPDILEPGLETPLFDPTTNVAGGIVRVAFNAGKVAATKIAANEATKSEVTVYRAFGGDARAGGFSWTPVKPTTVSNFRDLAGLPSGGASGATNTAGFMLTGKVNPANIMKTRSALPLDGNAGGFPEFIIDPKNVRLIDFNVIKP